MKSLLIFLSFLFSINSIKADTIKPSINPINPVNKTKKSIKTNKNCFSFCNPYKTSSFCKLIQSGNYKAVENLINKGADINKKSIKLTPLMYAARHNRVDILKLLISKGAKLNTRSSTGYTALKWAKISGSNEAYKILLEARKK